jgi:hypothetical protein
VIQIGLGGAVGVPLSAGTLQISVATGAGCLWTASTSDAWIDLAGTSGGQGTGAIAIAVRASLTPRHGTVTVSWSGGNQPIDVDQAGCNVAQTVTLSPERQNYFMSAGPTCSFVGSPVLPDVPWISVSTRDGLLYTASVDVNTGPERIGHVTTAIGQVTIVQRAGNCVTAIAPTSQAFDENGGTGSFSVTAAPGCAWDTFPHNFGFSSELFSITEHGIGSGVVTFNVGVNPYAIDWSPYIIVGGTLQFQISQSACVAIPSPASFHVTSAGGVFQITGTSRDSCQWSVASNNSFIKLLDGVIHGTGIVKFDVAPNQSGQTRSATLTVGRSQTVVVTQDP